MAAAFEWQQVQTQAARVVWAVLIATAVGQVVPLMGTTARLVGTGSETPGVPFEALVARLAVGEPVMGMDTEH